MNWRGSPGGSSRRRGNPDAKPRSWEVPENTPEAPRRPERTGPPPLARASRCPRQDDRARGGVSFGREATRPPHAVAAARCAATAPSHPSATRTTRSRTDAMPEELRSSKSSEPQEELRRGSLQEMREVARAVQHREDSRRVACRIGDDEVPVDRPELHGAVGQVRARVTHPGPFRQQLERARTR